MLKKINNFFSSWRGLFDLRKLLKSGVRIAFYSEGNAYRGFLEPVVEELTTGLNIKICYKMLTGIGRKRRHNCNVFSLLRFPRKVHRRLV